MFSKEEMTKRRESLKKFICPECGERLELVHAKRMYKAYTDRDRARACVKCEYICFMGDAA